MDYVRGGLCGNLWAGVLEKMPEEMSQDALLGGTTGEMQVRKRVVDLWNSVTLSFVKTPDNYPVMEASDMALVLFGFGKDSSQALIVKKFWETVNQPRVNPSLVMSADHMVSIIEEKVGERLIKVLHCFSENPLNLLSQFNALKNEVWDVAAGMPVSIIIRDYAEYQVNLWVACQLATYASEQLFSDLSIARQEDCKYAEIDALFQPKFRERVKEWRENVAARWKFVMTREVSNLTSKNFVRMILLSFEDQKDRFAQAAPDTARVEQTTGTFSRLPLEEKKPEKEPKQETVTILWQDAYLSFVQNPCNFPLMEKCEKALVLAGCGKGSSQELAVTKFWALVNDPSVQRDFVYKIERHIASIIPDMDTDFKKLIAKKLNSLEKGTEKKDYLSTVVKVSEQIGQRYTKKEYASEGEKSVLDYIKYRVQFLFACKAFEFGTDRLTALALELQQEKTQCIMALRPLLNGSVFSDDGLISELKKELEQVKQGFERGRCESLTEAMAFFTGQLEETQRRLSHFDEETKRACRDAEEIKSLLLGTPYDRQVEIWWQHELCNRQKLMEIGPSNLTPDLLLQMVRQDFEEQAALFESFAS